MRWKSTTDYPMSRINFYLIIGVTVNGCHWWGAASDESAEGITEVTKEDSAIINMPSAGSHKSRVIEFSTSITGRRLARPQEIGRNGTYLERELDDSIPLLKDTTLFDFSSIAFSLFLLPALRHDRQNGNRFRDVHSRRLFLILTFQIEPRRDAAAAVFPLTFLNYFLFFDS